MELAATIRKLDEKWDFEPKIWTIHSTATHTDAQLEGIKHWQTDMDIMCTTWSMRELKAALAKCKNNVAFKGMTHILLFKNALESIYYLLLFIFNVWKTQGVITNGLNARTMNPQPKPGKNPYLIGNLRPIEWRYSIMKIYANMVYNRLYIYIIKNQILSPHQYASRQAVGAADCIKDIINDINRMQQIQFPATVHTKDATDAYNNMRLNIIMDKFEHHVGLNEGSDDNVQICNIKYHNIMCLRWYYINGNNTHKFTILTRIHSLQLSMVCICKSTSIISR